MTNILQFDFMQRAFVAGIIIAIVAPMIGIFLVVRRYSLLADTLAHVSLVGIVIGALTKVNPVFAAIGTSILASFLMEKLRRTKYMFGESVLAFFLSGSLAIASVLMTLSHGFATNLSSFLFGSISTVTQSDIAIIVLAGFLVIAVIGAFYKELFLISVDEEIAQASGIHTTMFNQLLLIVSAITVSVTMRIIGVLLVGALMVIPVITAMQFGKSFQKTLLLSIACSLFCVISGIYVSYYIGTPSGGTIVVIAMVMFLMSFFFKKKGEY